MRQARDLFEALRVAAREAHCIGVLGGTHLPEQLGGLVATVRLLDASGGAVEGVRFARYEPVGGVLVAYVSARLGR